VKKSAEPFPTDSRLRKKGSMVTQVHLLTEKNGLKAGGQPLEQKGPTALPLPCAPAAPHSTGREKKTWKRDYERKNHVTQMAG